MPSDRAIELKEGWQAEKRYGQRVYHYISGTFSLCGKLGFYAGELVKDGTRTKADCKECARKLDARK